MSVRSVAPQATARTLLRTWDAASLRKTAEVEVPGACDAISYSRDGTIIYIAGRQNGTRILRVEALQQQAMIPDALSPMSLAADGSCLVSYSVDGDLLVWRNMTRDRR